MRGRRPKPTALKELEGNPGKRALNDREPRFRRARLYCPRGLSPMARREWHRISRELDAAGLLTVADRAALAAYCQLYARWIRAETELQNAPLVIVTEKGFQLPNPLVGIANTAVDGMRKYLVEFGMTPSARSRLKVDPPVKPKSLTQQIRELLGEEEPAEEEVDGERN